MSWSNLCLFFLFFFLFFFFSFFFYFVLFFVVFFVVVFFFFFFLKKWLQTNVWINRRGICVSKFCCRFSTNFFFFVFVLGVNISIVNRIFVRRLLETVFSYTDFYCNWSSIILLWKKKAYSFHANVSWGNNVKAYFLGIRKKYFKMLSTEHFNHHWRIKISTNVLLNYLLCS